MSSHILYSSGCHIAILVSAELLSSIHVPGREQALPALLASAVLAARASLWQLGAVGAPHSS